VLPGLYRVGILKVLIEHLLMNIIMLLKIYGGKDEFIVGYEHGMYL